MHIGIIGDSLSIKGKLRRPFLILFAIFGGLIESSSY
jgi:hypothetical protein